jgi:hypothetical protein
MRKWRAGQELVNEGWDGVESPSSYDFFSNLSFSTWPASRQSPKRQRRQVYRRLSPYSAAIWLDSTLAHTRVRDAARSETYTQLRFDDEIHARGPLHARPSLFCMYHIFAQPKACAILCGLLRHVTSSDMDAWKEARRLYCQREGQSHYP